MFLSTVAPASTKNFWTQHCAQETYLSTYSTSNFHLNMLQYSVWGEVMENAYSKNCMPRQRWRDFSISDSTTFNSGTWDMLWKLPLVRDTHNVVALWHALDPVFCVTEESKQLTNGTERSQWKSKNLPWIHMTEALRCTGALPRHLPGHEVSISMGSKTQWATSDWPSYSKSSKRMSYHLFWIRD